MRVRRLADYPHQFSGGERQRIMLLWRCSPVELLIADEPTTAADVTVRSANPAAVTRTERRTEYGAAVYYP
jgi:ABC-type microcin C transport system duplicated ATPase subunit YejF